MKEINEINEIKLPKGVDRIAVKQHNDRIVIEFIPEEPEFKEGDFVYEYGRIMIVKNYPNSYHALIYPELDMRPAYNRMYAPYRPLSSLSFRHATEEEKQILIDAMKKDSKRWNAEKKCIEDIPKRKFKKGDKVVLKSGYKKSDGLIYLDVFDLFIGKPLTIRGYTDIGHVHFSDCRYIFNEDWLEPYKELKKGDLAIFWDDVKAGAIISLYDKKGHIYHYDSRGIYWKNAIKFEYKEQYEKVLRGEI